MSYNSRGKLLLYFRASEEWFIQNCLHEFLCYGLNCFPQNSRVDVLIFSTSKCDLILEIGSLLRSC